MLEQLDFWHWFIFAVGLLILELFAPGAFFLWMGIAAAIVGALLWLIPGMGWELQLMIFAVLSVVTIIWWRKRMDKNPVVSDQPNLNRRGQQYVGRTFTLDEPIVNGLGKIHVDDSTWKIEGNDCPAGTKITVTGVDGVILKVE